jgi:hypothetical protein
VVVLAATPVFGLVHDGLGVVTLRLFMQRDLSDMRVLTDFYESLEVNLRGRLTENGLYVGTKAYVTRWEQVGGC